MLPTSGWMEVRWLQLRLTSVSVLIEQMCRGKLPNWLFERLRLLKRENLQEERGTRSESEDRAKIEEVGPHEEKLLSVIFAISAMYPTYCNVECSKSTNARMCMIG